MSVHLMTPSLARGDAIGNYIRSLAHLLGVAGFRTEIYADRAEAGVPYAPSGAYSARDDAVLWYHYSISSENLAFLASGPDTKIIDFHGIAPATLFAGANPELERLCADAARRLPDFADVADLAIAHSTYSEHLLRAAGFGKIVKLPLIVDPERFRTPADPALSESLRKLDYLLFVGRVVPQKSVIEMVELMAALADAIPSLRLLIVGGLDTATPYLEHVRRRIGELGLAERVLLLGKVSHPGKLRALFENARLLLSLSRWESFCVPIVEAFHFGVPALATNVAATPETVGDAGVLVPLAEPEAFAHGQWVTDWEMVQHAAAATTSLLGDAARMQDLRAAARERARRFTSAALERGIHELVLPAIERRTRRHRRRLRVGFVIQRYGEAVCGGAETLCKGIATRIARHVDVEVLTTCAQDYITWTSTFAPGLSRDGDVAVRRFPVIVDRNPKVFDPYSAWLLGNPQPTMYDDMKWMRLQGPRAPALLTHLRKHQDEYDAFVFFCYLYYTTYFGLQIVRHKSILVPTAHNEPTFYVRLFRPLFRLPREIIYCSREEMRLSQDLMKNDHVPSQIAGTGIDPITGSPDVAGFRRHYGIDGAYLLFAGRISLSKNCESMILFFSRYVEEHGDSAPTLVLLGVDELSLLETPKLRKLGFVPEEDKRAAFSGALAVVNPSFFESLSLLVLEAWSFGVPVLVNGDNMVLAEHLEAAGGGLAYRTYEEFRGHVERLLTDPALCSSLGKQGRRYVLDRYNWDVTVKKYLSAMVRVSQGKQ
ncbi:MAG: glycosyltransferase family 4 protein [Candidatus Schekmanbacteria bacterium]|nr:glycosyltransferase family 4 protein [Candidatus Schekmanbacteria bacterium]